MHTLLLLSLLASFSPETAPASLHATAAPAGLVSSRLQLLPASASPDVRYERLHLLNTRNYEQPGTGTVVARFILEPLVGLTLGMFGILGGTSLYLPFKKVPGMFLMPAAFMVLGNSTGVYIVGSMLDANGSFGFTLLGGTLGLVVPLAVGLALFSSNGCSASSLSRLQKCEGFFPVAISMLVLPTVGAMIGYELSSSSPVSESSDEWSRSSNKSPAPRIVPTLSATSRGLGATLGIAGLF